MELNEMQTKLLEDCFFSMTEEEFNTKLQRSYEQSLRGEGRPFNEVFDELSSDLIKQSITNSKE